jgi:hypothetical protein
MANRFDFQSPGAAMGDAFVQALMQREAMRRQAALDELNRRETEAKMSQSQEQLELQRTQEARMRDAEARQTRADEDDWAYRRTQMAGANEKLTPDEQARLQRAGYGGRTDERLESRTAAMPIMPFAATSPVTTPTSSEGGVFLRPGFQYEQAREAADERALLRGQQDEAAKVRAAADAAARAERGAQHDEVLQGMNNSDNQTRLLIAAMSGRQKEDAAAEKQAEKDRAIKANTAASIKMRDDVIYRVDQLLGVDPKTKKAALKPGVGSLYGSVQGSLPPVVGSFLNPEAGNARAALDGLIALLDVDTIRTMKEQSRTGATGFGALSEKELNVLENAATTLRGRTMDEPSALKELIKIRNEMVTAKAKALKDQTKQTPPAGDGNTGGARILSRRPAGQ